MPNLKKSQGTERNKKNGLLKRKTYKSEILSEETTG
jgi:hypothetical protein